MTTDSQFVLGILGTIMIILLMTDQVEQHVANLQIDMCCGYIEQTFSDTEQNGYLCHTA